MSPQSTRTGPSGQPGARAPAAPAAPAAPRAAPAAAAAPGARPRSGAAGARPPSAGAAAPGPAQVRTPTHLGPGEGTRGGTGTLNPAVSHTCAPGEGTRGSRWRCPWGGHAVSPVGDKGRDLNPHLSPHDKSSWAKPPGATRCRGCDPGVTSQCHPQPGLCGGDPIGTGNVPSEPTWTDWGAWGPCSRSCGGSGTRLRRRSCKPKKNPPCPGRATEEQKCHPTPCAGNPAPVVSSAVPPRVELSLFLTQTPGNSEVF